MKTTTKTIAAVAMIAAVAIAPDFTNTASESEDTLLNHDDYMQKELKNCIGYKSIQDICRDEEALEEKEALENEKKMKNDAVSFLMKKQSENSETKTTRRLKF